MKITNWKDALLGKRKLAKVAMAIFWILVLVSIGSCMFGCQSVQAERSYLTVNELTTEQMFLVFGEDLSTWPNPAWKEYMSRVHGNK